MTDSLPPSSTPLTARPGWTALERHYALIGGAHLRQLFEGDPGRGARLAAEAAGLYLDYSKNRVTDETLRLLIALADECGLRTRIQSMFRGERCNVTEDRAALHVALRAPQDEHIRVDGADVVPGVHAVLARMSEAASLIRGGAWRGHSGLPVRNIVNIGIGGSDLGPAMACEALRHYSRRDLTFRFVSNVDGTDFQEATRDLDPAETLFVVCSKTFTTVETMANARAARRWCLDGLGDAAALRAHFVAVSANAKEAAAFGIEPANTFGIWDWVGGRYSMPSAVGLSIMIAIGPDNFRDMLAGFRAMDEHFRSVPFERNLPVILGLLTVWYANFFGAETTAVLPYERYLARFPAYVQQLAMESNGKSVSVQGARLDYRTSPVYWGEPGTNGQHSFFQLLHQGTRLVPCDFIGFAKPLNPPAGDHDILIANMLAQGRSLAFGRTEQEVRSDGLSARLAPHRVFEGNRPSNTILGERLTPASLGALVALYEHSVFTQGTIWNIDSFDQWGVELGKTSARETLAALRSGDDAPLGTDSSTRTLLRRYLQLRDGRRNSP